MFGRRGGRERSSPLFPSGKGRKCGLLLLMTIMERIENKIVRRERRGGSEDSCLSVNPWTTGRGERKKKKRSTPPIAAGVLGIPLKGGKEKKKAAPRRKKRRGKISAHDLRVEKKKLPHEKGKRGGGHSLTVQGQNSVWGRKKKGGVQLALRLRFRKNIR